MYGHLQCGFTKQWPLKLGLNLLTFLREVLRRCCMSSHSICPSIMSGSMCIRSSLLSFLFLFMTSLSPSRSVASLAVGAQIFTSWSRPLVASIGKCGCGSNTLIWKETRRSVHTYWQCTFHSTFFYSRWCCFKLKAKFQGKISNQCEIIFFHFYYI